MMAPGGAATVRLSLTISLSAFGFTRFRELVQLFFPGSGLPTSLGSLVRYLARASYPCHVSSCSSSTSP